MLLAYIPTFSIILILSRQYTSAKLWNDTMDKVRKIQKARGSAYEKKIKICMTHPAAAASVFVEREHPTPCSPAQTQNPTRPKSAKPPTYRS